jgi:hypothetical protein
MTTTRLHGGIFMHFLKSAFGITLMAALAGCFGGTPTYGTSAGYAGGFAEQDGGVGGPQPMLAFVDTGRTLNATAGQGVGVFVTYSTGGNWLIQWTCDTSITSESCSFQVSAEVLTPSAAIHLVNFVTAPGGSVSQSPTGPCYVAPAQGLDDAGSCPPIQQLTATATTTTDQDALSFTTPPGATISVDVQLNGQPSSQYFFFVQNGQVNGGYTGSLSDPMEFEPTSP